MGAYEANPQTKTVTIIPEKRGNSKWICQERPDAGRSMLLFADRRVQTAAGIAIVAMVELETS
jgi:hypothetical protein